MTTAQTAPWHPSIDPAAWQAANTDPTVIVTDGSNVTVTVRNGQLRIEDGPPGGKRSRNIPRVPQRVTRLIVLGEHGYITMEAIRWLADADISVICADQAHGITMESGVTQQDAKVLRAQAQATDTKAGTNIIRELLAAKLTGQVTVLTDILNAHRPASMITDFLQQLTTCQTAIEMRMWEAQSAMIYWQVWAGRVHVPFSPDDLLKVPGHWLTFGARTTMIRESPTNRRATDPVNAMLNYCYRIAETQAVQACYAYGLHPSMGILHADKQGRDSLALDLMECARPVCDKLILSMLDTGVGLAYESGRPSYCDRRWFREESNGQCVLVTPLTHRIAGFARVIYEAIEPYAEYAARLFAGDTGNCRLPSMPKSALRNVVIQHKPRLRAGVTVTDLIPEDLWGEIAALIPAPRVTPTVFGNAAGRPRNVLANRGVVAALIAHDLLGVSWPSCASLSGVSVKTCQARKKEWSRVTGANGLSVWQSVTELLAAQDYLQTCGAAT